MYASTGGRYFVRGAAKREAEREAGRRSGGRDKVSAPRPTLAAPLTLPCSTSPPKVTAQKGALQNQRPRAAPITNGTAVAHDGDMLTRQKEASFHRKDVKIEKKKNSQGLTSAGRVQSRWRRFVCHVMCSTLTSVTPLPSSTTPPLESTSPSLPHPSHRSGPDN